MGDHQALLTRLYEAFNRKDVEAVVAALHPDVDWPNLLDGGYIHGREAVRDYWTRQFAIISPEAAPIEFHPLPDGRLAVKVHYVVRASGGGLWTDEVTTNIYSFKDGLILRMDWG
ncbi:MAG: nuclear transport factor 2 family protein [Caulobacter sp.]|nr:nuclear transport factor 2 family protein [Caulobacter sp.]